MVRRSSSIWFFALLLLVVVTSVVAVGIIRARQAHAATPDVGVTWTCNPNLVVSANVRVVARCASGYVIDPSTTIVWFAYPTKDSPNASRMLSIFETAKATNSTVTFYFDTTDTSGSAYGCQVNNCRAIWAATTP